jgi:hypothetical protein
MVDEDNNSSAFLFSGLGRSLLAAHEQQASRHRRTAPFAMSSIPASNAIVSHNGIGDILI